MKNFIFCVVIILRFKSLRAWEKTIYMKLKPTTLLKVALHHGCFYFLKIVQMVPNRAKHRIYMRIGNTHFDNCSSYDKIKKTL